MTVLYLEIIISITAALMVLFAIFIVCWLLSLSKAQRHIVKLGQSNRQVIEEFDRKLVDLATHYEAQPKVLNDNIGYLRSVADDMRWQVTNKDISLADQLDTLTRQCHNLSHQQVEVSRCIAHLSSSILSNGPREANLLSQERPSRAVTHDAGSLHREEAHYPDTHRPGPRRAPAKASQVDPSRQARMERHFDTHTSRKVVTLGDHLARQAK